jgi:hypothetical protein
LLRYRRREVTAGLAAEAMQNTAAAANRAFQRVSNSAKQKQTA